MVTVHLVGQTPDVQPDSAEVELLAVPRAWDALHVGGVKLRVCEVAWYPATIDKPALVSLLVRRWP